MCLLERFCKVKSEVMLLDIAFFVFIRENEFTFKKEKSLDFTPSLIGVLPLSFSLFPQS